MSVKKNKWYHIDEEIMPKHGVRLLVCSPKHRKDPSMFLRLLDSQFLSISSDVEYWMIPDYPLGIQDLERDSTNEQ